MSDRERNAEQILLALFDAHARVSQELTGHVDRYDDPDERGIVIEVREKALQRIANTAVDRVGKQIELSEEYAEERGRGVTGTVQDAVVGDHVRFIHQGTGDLYEGEVTTVKPHGVAVDDPDFGEVFVQHRHICDDDAVLGVL